MRYICLLLALVAHSASPAAPKLLLDRAPYVEGEEPWDIDGPCRIYIDNLSKAIGTFVQCATNFSIPPKVCTNCFDQYMAYKQVEWDTKHLNATALDNSTCSDVIYRNYLLSYVNELGQSIDARIWEASRCSDCITIEWDFKNRNSSFDYVDNVGVFRDKLETWRRCISNYTVDMELIEQNKTAICTNCNTLFDDLYKFYWHIYVTPNVQFCVDVETTMNDTSRLWNNIWNCSTTSDRKRDFVPVAITAGLLFLFTIVFYLSSYIQGGERARQFVQYSRITEPEPNRQRLLSTSASETNMSSRSGASSTARVHRRPN